MHTIKHGAFLAAIGDEQFGGYFVDSDTLERVAVTVKSDTDADLHFESDNEGVVIDQFGSLVRVIFANPAVTPDTLDHYRSWVVFPSHDQAEKGIHQMKNWIESHHVAEVQFQVLYQDTNQEGEYSAIFLAREQPHRIPSLFSFAGDRMDLLKVERVRNT